METPICDFGKQYVEKRPLRLHMPGHKGHSFLGMESLDLTEVEGADSLYEAEGIIQQSEENASRLFGCPTFYSTEGSSQCIRAMLYLAMLDAKEKGTTPRIAAARNVHKTFLSGAALLDLDVDWLYPVSESSYLSCPITPAEVADFLAKAPQRPTAVYLTSPDYLGNVADIRGIARVCRRYNVLLLVDNAHGAYLRFLEPSQHPMDLGADLCCDSAHKTLPVLTGGAYLHTKSAWAERAKGALALFGSTSPSYLILQSLDAANAYLETYPPILQELIARTADLKQSLAVAGYALMGQEPLKITISAKPFGYTGTALGEILKEKGIICEFADPDFLVLMLTPEIGEGDLQRLLSVLVSIPKKAPLNQIPPVPCPGQGILSIREAMLSPWETVPTAESLGRVLAAPSVGCPPAVPILVCGERITPQAVSAFQYYGVETVAVVKDTI